MDILQEIKNALKKAGIDEKYAGKIKALFNVESTENLDNYIGLFKENILPDLQPDEQGRQTAIETAIAGAIKTYEDKYKIKDGKPLEEVKEPDKPDLSKVSPEVLAILKAQNKQIADLTENLQTMAGSVSTSQKQASASALFSNSKLPQKWFGRIDVNAEKSVEDQIKDLQGEYTEIQQSIINGEVEKGNYKPNPDGAPKDRTEEEWSKIMDGDEKAKDSGTVDLGLGK